MHSSAPPPNTFKMTAIAYVPAVVAMMTVGVLVPFIDRICADLGASRAEVGFAVALFSMPSAVLATMAGGLMDSYGLRRSMLYGAAVSALGSVLVSQARSLLALDVGMALAGLGFGALCVAMPCVIIATLRDAARIRAMSFASTFAPTGYAAGLLMAVPYANSDAWRMAMLAHAALTAAVFLFLCLVMPALSTRHEPSQRLGQRTSAMLRVFREVRAVRLGIALALPNALSYGTSLAAPSYLARVQHLSLAQSTVSVAVSKLVALIVGGLFIGYLLSRRVAPRLLFSTMALIGLLAQALLFLPSRGIALATVALMLWLFAFGGMTGGAMTLLPSVARDPARSGATSGLINQFISLASFVAPSTWLALHEGRQYVLLAAACLIVSALMLPGSIQTMPTAVSRRESAAPTAQ